MFGILLLVLAGCVAVALAAARLLRPVLPAWQQWLQERSRWRRLDAELARSAREQTRRIRAGSGKENG